ncbi:Inositol phosphatase SIW14 [Savitreella phatthalungensis]
MVSAQAAFARLRALRTAPNHPNASEVLTLAKPLIQHGQVHKAGAEAWDIYEQAVLAALEAGDDGFAQECVIRISDKFPQSARALALRGMAIECATDGNKDGSEALAYYDRILAENPTNALIIKRKAACLKSLGKVGEAVTVLSEYVDNFYADADAWLELGDLYASLSQHEQAAFSRTEALLLRPNDARILASLGDAHYALAATPAKDGNHADTALECYLRGLELNDGSIRNLCGAKATTNYLRTGSGKASRYSAKELEAVDARLTEAIQAVPPETLRPATANLVKILLSK